MDNVKSKTALIIGVNGQIGFYLRELLLKEGYEVHGIVRHSSHSPDEQSYESNDYVSYHHGDLGDSMTLRRLLCEIRPREVYNLGSMSNAQVSFDLSEYVQKIDGIGTLRLLEAVRSCSLTSFTRVYQAGSSELFGTVTQSPQTETTPFHPRSPYGISKLFSYYTIINYREAYGIHASNGILYNSESPHRNTEFVTRKITLAVARIKRGLQSHLEIGNLDARRDWSHVKDLARGMWLILQQDKGDDYVLCSGVLHSVRDFVVEAFGVVGIRLVWNGDRGSMSERGVDSADRSRVLVKVNPSFFRPQEKYDLCGNYEKARRQLKWQPKTSFFELVREMVMADLDKIDKNIGKVNI